MSLAMLPCSTSKTAMQLLDHSSTPVSSLTVNDGGKFSPSYKYRGLNKVPVQLSFRKSTRSIPLLRVSATAAVEPVSVEDVVISESIATIEADSTENQPKRKSNRSKEIVVSAEQLVAGATFPGKVTTIQPFGAFVDLGAFTSGLIHISRLRKSYVKKVEDVVQVGQDVNVQVLSVDFDANRISLMLVGEEEEQSSENEASGENQTVKTPRTPRRGRVNNAVTKLKKDEVVTGTVKNVIKSGVFLGLPDGCDGYLPVNQITFKGPSTELESQFQIGQEVTVRVLRVEKGRVMLTTKQAFDFDKINEALNRDVVGGATNPFEIAFRRNELIANYLDEKEKQDNMEEVVSESAESIESESSDKDMDEANIENASAADGGEC